MTSIDAGATLAEDQFNFSVFAYGCQHALNLANQFTCVGQNDYLNFVNSHVHLQQGWYPKRSSFPAAIYGLEQKVSFGIVHYVRERDGLYNRGLCIG